MPEFVVVGGEEINQKWYLLPLVEMGTAPPITPGYDMLCANDSICSPPYILG